MRCFCTLFDHKYLSRGLVMYESLLKQYDEFKLYILAMDRIAFRKLESLHLKFVKLIDIEDVMQYQSELRMVKENRTHGEFCWTCTPILIEYVLKQYNEPICTYLDSDICFFASPDILLEELHDNVTMLIPHNYIEEDRDVAEKFGKYCVEFVPFRNNSHGLEILNTWKQQCIECCCFNPQNGNFGDQKYVEEWENEKDVIVTECVGAGVAPWNVNHFYAEKKDDAVYLTDKAGKKSQLIFYHFSCMKWFDKDVIRLDEGNRPVPESAIYIIYAYYIKQIMEVNERYNLTEEDYNLTQHFISDDLEHLKNEHGYYRRSELIAKVKEVWE